LAAYIEWQGLTRHIPKTLRYSLGIRIDALFAELIELTSEAQFELKERRAEIIGRAVTKNDTLKFMLYALSELKGIEEPKFISLSLKLEEVGRMLYGWKNQTQSQLKTDTPIKSEVLKQNHSETDLFQSGNKKE
jgi:hypothetical protein